MKLTKSVLKRIIKEEVQKVRGNLKEISVAQKAAQMGAGPEGDLPLDEMASVADVASDRGLETPDHHAAALLKWFRSVDWSLQSEDVHLELIRHGRNNKYVIVLDKAGAREVQWPEKLAADWTIEWDVDSSKYIIFTDVPS